MDTTVKEAAAATPPVPQDYEAPRVEVVLDAQSLQREVHYAGRISIPGK